MIIEMLINLWWLALLCYVCYIEVNRDPKTYSNGVVKEGYIKWKEDGLSKKKKELI